MVKQCRGTREISLPLSSLRPATAPPPGAATGPRITATLHHLPSLPCQKVD